MPREKYLGKDLDKHEYDAYAFHTLAGPLAQGLFSGRFYDEVFDDDDEGEGGEWHQARVLVGGRLPRLVREIASLLTSRWPAVVRVADELLERVTLDGQTVGRLLEQGTAAPRRRRSAREIGGRAIAGTPPPRNLLS